MSQIVNAIRLTGPARGRAQHGVAAVELALIIMVMFSLTLGTVEVGRALQDYDILTKSVRSAARYYTTLNDATLTISQRKALAKCVAAYANPGCTPPSVVPNITAGSFDVLDPNPDPPGTGTGDLVVKQIATGAGTLDMVTVSIASYPFTPWMSSIFPAITLGPISVTMPYVFF